MNIQFLENAIIRLEEGLIRYEKDTSDTQIRDGLIQRFEFTYDLSYKTLKRYLESVSATPSEYDRISFADFIRSANEQGLLLGDWPKWRQYRHMRNQTSHTYDEAIALSVVEHIPEFLKEILFYKINCESIWHDFSLSSYRSSPHTLGNRQVYFNKICT